VVAFLFGKVFRKHIFRHTLKIC